MARRPAWTRTSRVKPTFIKIQIALSINRGIHPGKSGFLPINARARHRHYMAGRLLGSSLIAVPVSTQSCRLIADDIGTRRAVSLSSPSPQSVVCVYCQRGQYPAFACQRLYVHSWPFLSLGNCASAAAFSSRRVDMQHRSAGRTGPRLAAGYAMCFRCERNGATIRLHRHDQAPWHRYRRDKRRNAVLGRFCAKQSNWPRHAKRKLHRCQRQRCRRPGSRRQGADRRIPPHDNIAAVVGRRPDRT